MKGSRYQCILAPLFKMLEATLELIVPLIIAKIIDKGIATADRNYIIKLSAQLFILGLVGLIFSITAQYFAASASVSFIKRLRHSTFEKVQSLSFAQYDSQGTSTLITRLTSDMDSIQNGINLTLRLLLRSPFVVFGACIMAFAVGKSTSWIFALAVPVLSLIVFGIMALTIPLNKKIREAVDGMLITVRETVTGTRVLRAFNSEEKQFKEFTEKNDNLTMIQEKTGKISAMLNPLTCLVINTSIGILLYVGARKVFAGDITCGIVVALYNYMSQILVELIKLANLIVTLTKSIACAGRVSSLLKIEEDIKPEGVSTDNKGKYIVFNNVSFAYNGASENSLDSVSFEVSEGEKIGIIGPTGSGKTTLISLLCGFYPTRSGHIFIEGKDINSFDEEELNSKISLVEQKPVIFRGTVRSNLTAGNKNASDEEILNALKSAQALEFVSEKESGTDSVTEQNGRNFSGGQRQRLAVARALVKKADIIILDDASSALDYVTDAEMRKEIFNRYYKAAFIVSQRTGSIMNCDKIILLEDGKATVGTHSELLSESETYREIHNLQFEEDAV